MEGERNGDEPERKRSTVQGKTIQEKKWKVETRGEEEKRELVRGRGEGREEKREEREEERGDYGDREQSEQG